MYRLRIINGASNLPTEAPIGFRSLENAIARAMALPPSLRGIIESWNGTEGRWVPQMKRTAAHTPPEGFGRATTPPTLRFCRDETGCSHWAPTNWEPCDSKSEVEA